MLDGKSEVKRWFFIASIFAYHFLLYGDAGLFMALQPKIIACGNSVAAFAMAVRFITGPAVMAAASVAVGLRGVLLHIAIVQVKKRIPSVLSFLVYLILFYQTQHGPSLWIM